MSREENIDAEKRVYVGENKTLHFVVLKQKVNPSDPDQPEDITGWDLEWQLLSGPGGRALVTKRAPNVTIVSGPDGELTVPLLGSETKHLQSDTYYYRLRRLGAEGYLATGDFVLLLG